MCADLVLHIGYHKMASTWLQRVLIPDAGNNFHSIGERYEARKDIVSPRTLDYDAEKIRKKYGPLVQFAKRKQMIPIISDERFSGNPMSGGFDSKEIADRVKDTFPQCKIVLVIREQRSMLYSTYDEYVREGGLCGIESFLFPISRYCMPPFRFEHFMYDKLIYYYSDLFSKENILVLPYELFVRDGEEFVRRLGLFCDARVDEMLDASGRMNRSRSASVLPIERRLNYFLRSDDLNGYSTLAIPRGDYYIKPLLEKIAAFFPSAVEEKVRGGIEKEIQAACKGRFATSNRRTEALTSWNLEEFGYECETPGSEADGP